MPAPDTAKTRTVGDIMSTPVIVAAPDDKVAEAAARMREQRVGSVVVVDDSRPVGILTERDLVRIAAAGADTGDGNRPGLDDREPRLGRARTSKRRPRSPASPSTATGTSRWSTTTSSSASCRCATSCASRRSSRPRTSPTRSRAGSRAWSSRRRRSATCGGSRASTTTASTTRSSSREKRSIEDVWYLLFEGALPTQGRGRGVPPSGSRRCARSPPRS